METLLLRDRTAYDTLRSNVPAGSATVRVRHPALEKRELIIDRFVVPYATCGDGPLSLVCVNGVQQTMAAWRPFIRRFGADSRYRLVLFDFPNQGRARIQSGPVDVPLSEQVAILEAVLQTVSPHAPVAIIGGSWGAVVAAALAGTRPSRVSRLILGSFQTKSNIRLRELAQRGHALIERGDLDALGTLFIEGFGDGMSTARQQRLREQFRRLKAEHLRQMYVQGETLLACGDIEAFVDLRAVRARTLIVNGADDPIVDTDDLYEAARRIPDCDVRLLPGVGHFLHLEQPRIMDIFGEFLAQERGRTAR